VTEPVQKGPDVAGDPPRGPDEARPGPQTAPGPGHNGPPAASHVTAHGPTTVINETSAERLDREVGPDAPRRDRLFAAASAKGVPLRTILTIDAVVIATWVVYRLLGRLREVILWVLIAAFIALVLNPSVNFLQRHRFRRGTAVGVVLAGAVVAFAGLLGLLGYPLVNSLTHVAERLPAMVDQVQKGHGWLAHTLQRFHLLSWVQKNAPKLKTAANHLGAPALNVGTNLAKGVLSTILAITTIAFLTLFMLLQAPNLRRGLLDNMRSDRRAMVEDIAHRVSKSVTSYVLGTIALSVLVGGLIAGVPSVIIALLHSPTAGVVMAIVFVGFQLVENHFLYPVVMSRTVQMNPLWVLLAVLVGANLGGVFGSTLGALTGALVAIPVGGAIQVVSREVWQRTRAAEIPPGEPLPEARPGPAPDPG
jgi:predicted PurR-regulated permease PerM